MNKKLIDVAATDKVVETTGEQNVKTQGKGLTRRRFITGAAIAIPSLALLDHGLLSGQAKAASGATESATSTLPPGSFAFPLLGDLHFDRLEHHDMEWMEKEYSKDIRQVQNYSRITAETLPQLMSCVQTTIAGYKRGTLQVPFVAHIGDFVEGVCGSRELDTKQKTDAIAFLREKQLGAPFLFCKGNHDITGPGSKEAFDDVFLPFLTEESNGVRQNAKQENAPALDKALYSVRYGDALFVFFDAYNRADSLDWLEATLDRNTARHVFVLIHPPVVPYGARTTWHLYARPQQAAERERLLRILGKHKAFVLTGHLHKYNLMTRRTENGRFLQLSVNSVISRPDARADDILDGVDNYTPDQIRVEPNFSPTTEAERRANIAAEAPFVDHFEYASAPGYAVIEVQGERVLMNYYLGATQQLWRSRDLSAILNG